MSKLKNLLKNLKKWVSNFFKSELEDELPTTPEMHECACDKPCADKAYMDLTDGRTDGIMVRQHQVPYISTDVIKKIIRNFQTIICLQDRPTSPERTKNINRVKASNRYYFKKYGKQDIIKNIEDQHITLSDELDKMFRNHK